jgi:catechol 2,3-dioxygenase-like lactoylglutathione lyase family enzyme
MGIIRIDHVQVAIPAGGEPAARDFYAGLLGIPETAKPTDLAGRGGVWFESADLKVHAGVDHDFKPARKAHPGFVVEGLPELIERLRAAQVSIAPGETLAGHKRVFVSDPFGNRIELIDAFSEEEEASV